MCTFFWEKGFKKIMRLSNFLKVEKKKTPAEKGNNLPLGSLLLQLNRDSRGGRTSKVKCTLWCTRNTQINEPREIIPVKRDSGPSKLDRAGPILADGPLETMCDQFFLWPKIKCLFWNSFLRVFNFPSAMMSCSSPRNLAAWWKGSNTALWLSSAAETSVTILGCCSDHLWFQNLFVIRCINV